MAQASPPIAIAELRRLLTRAWGNRCKESAADGNRDSPTLPKILRIRDKVRQNRLPDSWRGLSRQFATARLPRPEMPLGRLRNGKE
jgi:hypothetical protein